jgi:hypothetical protein
MPGHDQAIPGAGRAEAVSRALAHWKGIVATLGAAAGIIWLSVTWADDKLRKIDRVPAIEEAVLQLKLAHEEAHRRDDERMEQQQRDTQAIITRLDALLQAERRRE